jgi:hypothetical protein
MADAKNTTPPNLADHIAHLADVLNALGLAIEGLRLDKRTPGEASQEGLVWLADYAREVTEGVYCLANDVGPRWRILSAQTDLIRDLDVAAGVLREPEARA